MVIHEHRIIEKLIDDFDFILITVLFFQCWTLNDWETNWSFQFHFDDYFFLLLFTVFPNWFIKIRLTSPYEITTNCHSNITVASKCASGLKSPVGRLFVQQLLQLKTKEIKKSNAIWRHDANVSLSVRDWKTCRIDNNLVLPVRMSENI